MDNNFINDIRSMLSVVPPRQEYPLTAPYVVVGACRKSKGGKVPVPSEVVYTA